MSTSPFGDPRRWASALAVTLAALVLIGAGTALARQDQQEDFRDSPFLRIDPEKILMSERDPRDPCGECHTSAFEVWEETAHATGFETMHRSESARSILRAMDLRMTKRKEALCMRCHYTVKAPDMEAIAGVSCESCHGPARDWKDIHNDWGEGVEHPDDEDPEHRRQRIARSVEAGMLRPSGDLYAVAANCFECHTVPREDLVNTGGHKSGSGSFDLLEWSAEIRHNFVHEQWGGEGGNREPSVERKRAMVVVDRLLKYEFGLRGMAVATEDGGYAKSMERRVTRAYRDLDALASLVALPEVDEIVEIGADLSIRPNNRETLLGAADRIRDIGQELTSRESLGSELGVLDPVLDGAPLNVVAARNAEPASDAASDAAPEPEEETPDEGPEARPDETPDSAAVDTPTPEPEESAPPEAAPDPETPELPGRVRSRPAWFEDAGHEVLLPGDCVDCHESAESWYYDDPHQSSNAALLNRTPEVRRTATLYGIAPTSVTKADALCMNCHGTIQVAAPVEVYDPVTCESCHGPASDYYDPHQDGGNPQLGMRELKDATARAENCSRCHLVTDERLLASGHPSGSEYDFVEANRRIEHWPDERRVGRNRSGPYPDVSDAALRSAWQAVAGRRPIPSVTVVSLPERTTPSPTPAPDDREERTGNEPDDPAPAPGEPPTPTVEEDPSSAIPVREAPPATDVTERGEAPVPSVPPSTPSARPTPRTSPSTRVELDPPPESIDSLTADELLLLVKTRLERLYRLLGRGG